MCYSAPPAAMDVGISWWQGGQSHDHMVKTVTLEPGAYATAGGVYAASADGEASRGFRWILYPNESLLKHGPAAYVLSIPFVDPGNQWRLQHNAGWQAANGLTSVRRWLASGLARPDLRTTQTGLPPCGHLHDGHRRGRIPNVMEEYSASSRSEPLRSDPHLSGPTGYHPCGGITSPARTSMTPPILSRSGMGDFYRHVWKVARTAIDLLPSAAVGMQDPDMDNAPTCWNTSMDRTAFGGCRIQKTKMRLRRSAVRAASYLMQLGLAGVAGAPAKRRRWHRDSRAGG